MQKQNPVIKNYILSSQTRVLGTKFPKNEYYNCDIFIKQQNTNNLDSHVGDIRISG